MDCLNGELFIKKSKSNRSCCVVGCSNLERKNRELHFYNFPSRPHEEGRKKKWIIAVRRNNHENKNLGKRRKNLGKIWEPNKWSRICSAHFEGGEKSNDPRKVSYNPTIFPEIHGRKLLTYDLVFNQAPSTSTTEQQPSTSAAEELQYQPSRYSIVSGKESALLEEIIIKEEITDDERNQCRLCLSVGRKMQELGEYAPLYRKLLFENNYQNTTIPSFMFSMLACWECLAELRRIQRFQDKVRRANNAFETSQNKNCENLSNLSTILIGEYKNSSAGETQSASIEECAQEIKEEAVEMEVVETALPDPLEVGQDVKTTRQESEIYLQIEHEPNTSVTPQKVVKRPIPEPKPNQNQPKRTKLDRNVANPEPMRAELDQSGSKTTQEEENYPKSVAETDCDAIFGKVKIEIDELEKILAERRNKESFKSMKFKCDSCVLGFTDHNRLLEHNKNFHDEEVGSCECDICERRFNDEPQLSAHYRNHFVKFVCKLCNFECYTKTGRTIHFKRHKGALQGTSLEALLRKKQASEQRASASGSSRQSST